MMGTPLDCKMAKMLAKRDMIALMKSGPTRGSLRSSVSFMYWPCSVLKRYLTPKIRRRTAPRANIPVHGDEFIHQQGDLGRQRKFKTRPLEHGGELGDDEGQQNEKSADQGDGHHERILEGGFDVRSDLGLVLDDIHQSGEYFRDAAADLTGPDHIVIEGRENTAVSLHGRMQRRSLLDVVGDIDDGLLHRCILRLRFQNLQKPHQGNAGGEHGAKLFGENDQILGGNAVRKTPEFGLPARFGDGFLFLHC